MLDCFEEYRGFALQQCCMAGSKRCFIVLERTSFPKEKESIVPVMRNLDNRFFCHRLVFKYSSIYLMAHPVHHIAPDMIVIALQPYRVHYCLFSSQVDEFKTSGLLLVVCIVGYRLQGCGSGFN